MSGIPKGSIIARIVCMASNKFAFTMPKKANLSSVVSYEFSFRIFIWKEIANELIFTGFFVSKFESRDCWKM